MNKEITDRKEMASPYRKIPINICRGTKVNLKSFLDKHHSDNYQRQNVLKDAKISGQKLEK